MLGRDNLKPWIWVVAELVSPAALPYHICHVELSYTALVSSQTLALSRAQGQLSWVLQPLKGGASSAHPFDIFMFPGGSHGHWHKHLLLHDPHRQHGWGLHHGPRWQCRLLISWYYSPPLYLQFFLFSQCSNHSVSLSFPSLYPTFAHGSCFRQAMQQASLGVFCLLILYDFFWKALELFVSTCTPLAILSNPLCTPI